MSGLMFGAELTVGIAFLALAVFLVWIAKAADESGPKYSFLKSETAQVIYTVFCICLLALGLVIGMHGIAGYTG